MKSYQYTNLREHDEWVDELGELEARMSQAIGVEVRLVAYSPKSRDSAEEALCRAGLDG
ncbi:hypothetical protein [Gorillibacterium sp. CAU 1737]|uniref:hypothetical protein n=1 Tax=Gorillibacterium sp. CAU 1737 TaxID=3140362 RepID=UPI0032615D18